MTGGKMVAATTGAGRVNDFFVRSMAHYCPHLPLAVDFVEGF